MTLLTIREAHKDLLSIVIFRFEREKLNLMVIMLGADFGKSFRLAILFSHIIR